MPTRSTLALVLALASPGIALADSRIVTAGLPFLGTSQCTVVNASTKKTVEVTIALKNGQGQTVLENGPTPISPEGTTSLATTSTMRYCVVTVHKGGQKNLRVSYATIDGAGNALAVAAP